MSLFNAVYYPFYDPPPEWLRAMLLFYDKIEYIVPHSVDPKHSRLNSELFEKLPDTYGTLDEEVYGLAPSETEVELIKNALDVIVEHKTESGGVQAETMMLHRTKLNVDGYMFMHHTSAPSIVLDMLEDRNLISHERGSGHRFGDDYCKVDREAATFLVGILADQCATRKRLRTLTSESLPFCVSHFGSTDQQIQEPAADTCLASSIISFEIPEKIVDFSVNQYLDLRKRVQEIKPLFHHAIRQVVSNEMLEGIKDRKAFEGAVQQATQRFANKVAQFRISSYATKIKDWAPIGITAMGVGLAHFGVGQLGDLASGCGIAWQVYEKLSPARPMSPEEQVQRVLAQFQAEILEPSFLSRFVRKLKSDVSWD